MPVLWLSHTEICREFPFNNMSETSLGYNTISELINYNPNTGLFTWKKSRGGKVANSICGRIDTSGHRQITINNRSYLAHRIAIFIKNGSWPKNQIDHINGNKDDNRIINLRECSASQNQQNSKKRIDNKSGVKGVSWHNGRKNWVCQLQINKKRFM